MEKEITVRFNTVSTSHLIKTISNRSILEVARENSIYIPSLCSHPDLKSARGYVANKRIFIGDKLYESDNNTKFEGCGLCIVKIDGFNDFKHSCDTILEDGFSVTIDSPEIIEARKENLKKILKYHPHACLTCAQREGCSREPCSQHIPPDERCCEKFGSCEFEKVALYVGIKPDTPKYIPEKIPVIDDEPLFKRNPNLCIGCIRCVRICNEIRGVDALGFVSSKDRIFVGTQKNNFSSSGCRFCGACVEVCPTGAMLDKINKREELLPCKNSCPIGLDVPAYVYEIAKGNFKRSLQIIKNKLPFPKILGRICGRYCEAKCRRAALNEPVSVCSLKRFVADYEEIETPKFQITKNSKIAIIGAGPAGLSCAYFLSLLGYPVTIFESTNYAGGIMRLAIPEYRLPFHIVDSEIKDVLKNCVDIKFNKSLGKDFSIKDLKSQGYSAILIATGLSKGKKLNISNINRDEVFIGLDFLKKIKSGEVESNFFVNKNVVIIGGGNVAIDNARSAVRLNATSVKLFCLEKRDEMPAFKWEIVDAEKEGVEINNSWGPSSIIIDTSKDKLSGITFKKCVSVFDQDGKFNPSYDENYKISINADAVIVAIGQEVDKLIFVEEDLKDGFKIDDLEENAIFVCGDVIEGPKSVAHSIASGSKVAFKIDKFLGGKGIIEEELQDRKYGYLGKSENFHFLNRVDVKTIPLERRISTFDEVEESLSKDDAIKEANRCLRCDLRFQISQPVFPPEKWISFTKENLKNVPASEGVYQLFDQNKMCISIKGVQNLNKELNEKLTSVGNAKFFYFELDKMYTKRESELIQQHLAKYGKMPEADRELEDLF